MSRRPVWWIVSGATAALWCVLCSTVVGQPPATSRPAERQLRVPQQLSGGWTREEQAKVFTGRSLFQRINGAAELFLEMGFRQLRVEGYRKGSQSIELELYEMDSPPAALGMFLHKRGRENPIPGLEGRHTGNRFQILACQGVYFVQVNNFTGSEGHVPAMVELISAVLQNITDDPAVGALKLLPAEGRVPGSRRLVRGPFSLQLLYTFGDGDVLQLGGRVFGAAADYHTDEQGDFTRLIVAYDSPSAAASAFRYLTEHLDPEIEVLHHTDREMCFTDFRKQCGTVEVLQERLDIHLHLTCPCPRARESIRK